MSNKLLWMTLLLPTCASGCGNAETESWAGKTYLLQISKDRWSEPPRIGDEIGDFVPGFLLGVDGGNGSELAVTLGTADPTPAQEPCNPTAVISASEARYPSIDLRAPEFALFIRHPAMDLRVTATIHDLTLTNVLPDGANPAREGELGAVMDLRELYPLFTQLTNPTPDIVCMALESFGSPCEVCAFDGATYCLTVRAVRLGATEIPGIEVAPIDGGAVDPSCLAP